MAKVITGQFGQKARQQKNRRSSLCANGHHRWELEKHSKFDVKLGKLVNVRRCGRCGKTRITAD